MTVERVKAFLNLNIAMKYVLYYQSSPDVATLAPLHGAAHRASWKEYLSNGTLLMIGPFANPREGAMAIFTTREAAEEFAKGDPFVLNGVVTSWVVREWMEAVVPE
ncbi:MAG: YciI family protein [Candidatus Cybelea sp.]